MTKCKRCGERFADEASKHAHIAGRGRDSVCIFPRLLLRLGYTKVRDAWKMPTVRPPYPGQRWN